MDFAQISAAIRQDAAWVVFLNVLLQQAGLPVPAVPTLLLAGSLAVSSGQFAGMLAAATLASLLADLVWYLAGRAFGYRVLAGLCRLSINPGSCVSQTETRFLRWGLASLVVAKFVPGFSIVAPPIAGSLHMRLPGFLAAATVGAALWAGLALGAGWVLRHEVQQAIELLDRHTGSALIVVAAVIGLWLAWKLWQRFRFRALAAVPHITPDELLDALDAGHPLLVLDLRGQALKAESGAIPGATPTEHERLLETVGAWPKGQPIVTLCACPEDAGAIDAARRLLDAGYLSVRPLRGGYDAWREASERRAAASFSAACPAASG